MHQLEKQCQTFAEELHQTLDSALPGVPQFVVSPGAGAASHRFVITPAERLTIPLHIGDEELALLHVEWHLDLDSSGDYLKAVESKWKVYSSKDRTPLFRLEYDQSSTQVPAAHWHVHAERGALSEMLTHASLTPGSTPRQPNDLSKLHFPVGGGRFRPCLEDLVQFLILECGVDCKPKWKPALEEGRHHWRRRQLASAVRDAPDVAAESLQSAGWTVEPPAHHKSDARALREW